jgi:hypothetical protein
VSLVPGAAPPDPTASNRQRLRLLDACLDVLERAHERNESILTDELLVRLGDHVATLSARMTITEAIDAVLREQESWLAGRSHAQSPMRAGGRVRSGSPLAEPLDAAAARVLTESIKGADQSLCRLLLEAHERRAWRALGYSTWERYIKQELNMSRSRSYELLDQGRALRAIEAAAGASDVIYISTYAALQLKPHLAAVAEQVRSETRLVAAPQVPAVVSRIVDEFRQRSAAARDRRVRRVRVEPPADVSADLQQAIDFLARMPPVEEVLPFLEADDVAWLPGLPDAIRWLSELAILSSRPVHRSRNARRHQSAGAA